MLFFDDVWAFKIKPIAKPRMTRSDAWKKRKIVEDYWEYKDQLRGAWDESWEFPESFHLIFCMPMPESWSKKKKERMVFTPHLQTPDTDNLVKGFFDSLFNQDSMLYDFRASKFWSYDPMIVLMKIAPVKPAYVENIFRKIEEL